MYIFNASFQCTFIQFFFFQETRPFFSFVYSFLRALLCSYTFKAKACRTTSAGFNNIKFLQIL